jgi:hypothetical protein|tara:strand:- start:595 stop:1143 length:549 start_codon:yes stop_codon:yes gene_type:complete
MINNLLSGKKNFKYIRALLIVIMVEAVMTLPLNNLYAGEIVKLKVGTPVLVTLAETVSSENKSLGDSIVFEVARDVIVNDKVVVRSGANARGEVLAITQQGYVGQEGKITISINDVEAVDGQRVRLRATSQKEGEGKMGSTLALSVVICPLFLLTKGQEAEIPAGSEFKVYVDYGADIEVEE